MPELTSRGSIVLLLSGALLVAQAGWPGALRAQQGQRAEVPPAFRAGIDLVALEVSVLNKDRQPVRGLSAADFTVREDGATRPLEAFSEIDVPDPEATGTGWMVKAPSADVETNGTDSQRVIAILLDDAMIPQDPLYVRQTKLIAREVINRMGPRDVAAVVFSRDGRHAQSFTADHGRLLAAVETFSGGMAFARGLGRSALFTSDFPLYLASEVRLESVARALIALPDKRKLLVYVSEGIALDPATANGPVNRLGTGSNTVEAHEEQSRLEDGLRDVLEQAQRANVTVYTFDPGGLHGLEGYCAGHPPPTSICPSPYTQAGLNFFRDFHEFATTVATSTGGRATIFTNDPLPGIDAMFAENASYYLLGYRQVTRPKPGQVQAVDVKVNRKDVTVRARNRNYGELTDTDRAAKEGKTPPPPILEALANVLPDATLPLRLNLVPFAKADGTGAGLTVVIGGRAPTPTVPATRTLHVLMRAYTMEGDLRGESIATLPVTLTPPARPGPDATDARYDIVGHLDVPGSGHYAVRVSVQDDTAKATGSVYADVEVPDFTAPLSLSGIAVAVEPGTTAGTEAPGDLLRSGLTTSREFTSAMQVASFIWVYQGGRGPWVPAQLHTTLEDRSGAVVFEQTASYEATRFASTPSVGVRVDLPLNRLTAGLYRLTFDAKTHDREAQRAVAFSVK